MEPLKHNQTSGRCKASGTVALLVCAIVFSCNPADEDLADIADINKWEYFKKRDGVASNWINALYEDRANNLWIGTDQGLTRYDGATFTTYTNRDGLLSDQVFAITEDRDGNIWVGTTGGLNIFLNNEWRYFQYFAGAGIYALEQLDGDGGILIGTGGYGVYRYDYTTQRFADYNIVASCDECNSINAIFQAEDGAVWISSFNGVRKVKGNSVRTYNMTNGLPGNIATSIAEDSWGNIWVGTVEGATISRFTGNTISQVSFNNGADQNFIYGIQEDNEGKLWVGTVANGLFHYDGAVMRKIYQGPPGNTITVLFKDSYGNLWIGTSENGLAHFVINPPR